MLSGKLSHALSRKPASQQANKPARQQANKATSQQVSIMMTIFITAITGVNTHFFPVHTSCLENKICYNLTIC
jgi:hypothetical protein